MAGKDITADELIKMFKTGQPSAAPSQDITAENIRQIAAGAPPREGLSWLDVPVQAITNIPKSALEFGKGIYEAVTSPVQTAKGVLDIGAGTLRNLTPRQIADFIDKFDTNPEAAKRASETAYAIGKFYKDRYGSSEGFKQALASDPVGVAADVSTVLSGGGAALNVAGKTGKVAQLSAALSKAGEVTNPLMAPVKIGKAVIPATIGLEAGVGQEPFKRAAQAGFAGDQSLTQQMRGTAPMTQPLDDARHNLDVMRQNRSNAYRSGMVDITGDKSTLSFSDIDKALNKAIKETTFHGEIVDEAAHAHLQKLKEKIDDWKTKDPEIFHTPEGLDNLKKLLGAENEKIPYEAKSVGRVGKNIYDAVKGTISEQAPKYAEVMKDYAEASDQISEIERALSLGNKSSADTALRKLQSLSRNNVYTNYGQRLNLAQTLEAEGGRPFINAIAGQALSSATPRGLAQLAPMGTVGLAAAVNPMFLAALPMQSPRLMGEAAYAAGRVARPFYEAGRVVGATPAKMLTLADLLATQQQIAPEDVTNIQQMVSPR